MLAMRAWEAWRHRALETKRTGHHRGDHHHGRGYPQEVHQLLDTWLFESLDLQVVQLLLYSLGGCCYVIRQSCLGDQGLQEPPGATGAPAQSTQVFEALLELHIATGKHFRHQVEAAQSSHRRLQQVY